MKKFTTLTILFVIIFTMQSCGQNPELGKDKLDLKAFSTKFNVNDFYKNQIEIHKKFTALLSQGKTKEAFSDELLKNSKLVETIDTLMLDDKNSLLYYGMKGMGTKDTLATFDHIRFQRLDMFTNSANEFQSLRAISWTYKDGKKNFNALKEKLEIAYGNPRVIKENLEHKEYYEWLTKDLVINLVLNIEEEKDGNSFVANLYLTKLTEHEKFKSKVNGKTKYYWLY